MRPSALTRSIRSGWGADAHASGATVLATAHERGEAMLATLQEVLGSGVPLLPDLHAHRPRE